MIEAYNNIYNDPLTGLPNFFKFIESDTESVFGKQGSVILFDMINFTSINLNYGRDKGDLCLKCFSNIICTNLPKDISASVYRTGGDEFTVILPEVSSNDADNLAHKLREDFIKSMTTNEILDADVRILTTHYSSSILSVKQFYQMILLNSLKNNLSKQLILEDDKCLGAIIENFTKRIQETLSLLNAAYNLVLTDDISGLPNQRAAKAYLKNLVSEYETSKNEFSILFIDGDNLKRYNQIAYESGNEMIRNLGQVIANSLRKNDRVFRWLSGDEFLVILENVDRKDTFRLSERIRNSVEEQTIDWIYPITISIGVAYYPDGDSSIEEIISKAEKANSYAKALGKNKVIEWSSQMDM